MTSVRGTYRARTIMADFDELLVHELDAPQTWRLKQLDLGLDEQVERNLRHEQTWSRASRVADGRPDVLVVEVVCRVDGRERGAEDVVKNVVYPRTARELLRRDVNARALDRGHKVARKLGHQPQHKRSLLLNRTDTVVHQAI